MEVPFINLIHTFFSESSSKSDSMNNTGSYVIMWLDDNPRSYAMPLHCSMHGRVGGGRRKHKLSVLQHMLSSI